MERFEDNIYFGNKNRFSGSGGEILVKGDGNTKPNRMEVGDRLIGIGITERIENLNSADPSIFNEVGRGYFGDSKLALRAFRIAEKRKRGFGCQITLAALEPTEYSMLVEKVSYGSVNIPAETIPSGTIILSFIDPDTNYTLKPLKEGPSQNWLNATKGVRHWNVGIGKPDDFWMARFPSDNVKLLKFIPKWIALGGIWFGLSILSGSNRSIKLKKVAHSAPISQESYHDFCLNGKVVGSLGQKGQFPIGLKTKITFHPLKLES